MLHYAIVCLVIALIAAVLGATGIMSFALNAAYLLGVIAVILFIVHALTGKRT